MVTLAWHLTPAVIFLALSGSLTNIQTSPLNLDAVNQLYLRLGLFWESWQVSTQTGLRAEASLTVPLLTAPCSLHVWNAGQPQVLLRCCWPKKAAQAAGSTRNGLPTHQHPVCPRNRCFSQSLGAFPSASSAYSLRRNPVLDTRPSPPVPSHGPESSHPNQTRKRGLWLSHFLPFSYRHPLLITRAQGLWACSLLPLRVCSQEVIRTSHYYYFIKTEVQMTDKVVLFLNEFNNH